MSDAGLSPPTRGNPSSISASRRRTGSIPAHAGEPQQGRRGRREGGVYPRPRGGTNEGARLGTFGEGLSPPTRGNQQSPLSSASRKWSIPAHAGEPGRSGSRLWNQSVYPRPRGGTKPAGAAVAGFNGLSPPTRGNRSAFGSTPRSRRSIPAHAGEPAGTAKADTARGVYPRPRGGTIMRETDIAAANGLSPPTRGNRAGARTNADKLRSIPAHAGEPMAGRGAGQAGGVYPRPRGGTIGGDGTLADVPGLSPPTRGNRRRVPRKAPPVGSIPAHAGEPGADSRGRRGGLVYPRPRGGTSVDAVGRRARGGLSPPTRGNHRRVPAPAELLGSIPAHAGEPAEQSEAVRARSVYPRPRGGTYGARSSSTSATGLSPPTRGNPGDIWVFTCLDGSIPAHAGEPFRPGARPA